MKTFDEIARAIVDARGIEDAIVQQTVTRDRIRIAREPSSDAWKHRMPLRNEFRVFLKSSGGFCEAVGADFKDTYLKAFKEVGVEPPSAIQ